MPQKRPHRKSRYGCDQCRKRRVKCDEKAPRCTTCTNRGDECHFSRQIVQQYGLSNSSGSPAEPLDPVSSAHTDMSPHRSCESNTPSTSGAAIQESIAISDVALMHHWCTRTCYSFTPRGAGLFREFVGQEALRHGYLMEALRALTLLHMASETEESVAASPLVMAALRHQNQSFSSLRTTLGDISPANCEAVFACSVLIMVCGIVSPLLPSGGDDPEKMTAESLLRLVDLMSGVSSIVRLSRQWIVQGPLCEIFGIVEPNPSCMDGWAPAEELRRLVDAVFSPGSPRNSNLQRAIQGLEKVFRRDHCAVLWIIKVDSGFMDELRAGEPVALMIFMHWGVLLHVMDDMWWKQYSGSRLVEELSATLVGRGGEWDEMTRWCRQQVGLCG